jgi:serine/threonine protein kinase
MSKLKQPVTLETAFGSYAIDEILGEGGAGRVYGGIGADRSPVAVKVLSEHQATTDKRRRFMNEIAFLARTKHPNIVSVIDHGIAAHDRIAGPFYVMKRYGSNLRESIRRSIQSTAVLQLFSKILDGVEAAHFLGAVHRDLKPENILIDGETPAIADFGIANFTDCTVVTLELVETNPGQRLANFVYAAPEQRATGKAVGLAADIYALGMILNEMFTSNLPHGTEYESIGRRNPEFAFLDQIVARMMRQNPGERYDSIAEVKQAIARHQSEFLSLQKVSQIDETVIPDGEIDDPLALTPPKIVDADWGNGMLTLTMDRAIGRGWENALHHHMGGHSAVMGIGPERFQFRNGRTATVSVAAHSVQKVIDHFKAWLPRATAGYKNRLEQEAAQKKAELQRKLRNERRAEEERLQVIRNLKI